MIAQVALPLPIPKTFTYRIPSEFESFLVPYLRVKVPFAKRTITGLIVRVEKDEQEGTVNPMDIAEVIDLEPMVDSASFRLCSWAARHYCTPLGLALKSSFPLGMDFEKYLIVTGINAIRPGTEELRLKRAYAALGKEKVWQHYRSGLLDVRDVFTGKTLKSAAEPEQRGEFSVTLLGSEVAMRREQYLSLALPILASGSDVLLLLPDHGIAADYFLRFLRDRLGDRVLSYGSHISPKRRGEAYLRARNQGGNLFIGTRSCLFLPLRRLGLIMVERPEDEGYRNDQAMQFNAVSLAVKKAELQNIPVVYGSVSPPLDLERGVQDGSIKGAHVAPSTDKVDWSLPLSRQEPLNSDIKQMGVIPSLSSGHQRDPSETCIEIVRIGRLRIGEKPPSELIDLLLEGLDSAERIVIHTPLKEYAARLYCLNCHRPVVCPVCESSVSFRKKDNSLICWKCGRRFVYQERCTRCGSRFIGFSSTGAEFVQEQVEQAIPDVSVIKVTGEVVKHEGFDRLSLFANPRTIIVGTQILSKFYGLDAERLILIGWEDFLRIAGYRAREYIYQSYRNLIDSIRPSKIYLLCLDKAKDPAHVLTMNRHDFYEEELAQRKMADFPPYKRLFLLILDGAEKASGSSRRVERVRELIEKYGLKDDVVGENIHPGERKRTTILLKREASLPDGLIEEIYRLRHVRIEADPLWI
jgi:primosomal protein N' (replication factor Y) (superfamily II helicase)